MIRILVVDDDPKLNQAACTYLNDCGYEAKGCLSAEAAYDAMYSQLFDLIISDIMMPGTDGFEFAGNQASDNNGGVNYYQNSQDGMEEIVREAMRQSGNIPPTLTRNQGSRIGIFVGRDLDFSSVYGLALQ